MTSLFVIREKNTGTFCTSSKFKHFEADLQKAAMFNQRKNAESAARKMFAAADKGVITPYGGWCWRVRRSGSTRNSPRWAPSTRSRGTGRWHTRGSPSVWWSPGRA